MLIAFLLWRKSIAFVFSIVFRSIASCAQRFADYWLKAHEALKKGQSAIDHTKHSEAPLRNRYGIPTASLFPGRHGGIVFEIEKGEYDISTIFEIGRSVMPQVAYIWLHDRELDNLRVFVPGMKGTVRVIGGDKFECTGTGNSPSKK